MPLRGCPPKNASRGRAGRAGPFPTPALDRFRLQRGQQFAPPLIGAVVVLLHFGDIGRLAERGLGFVQLLHGLGILSERIQHDGQLVTDGVSHVQILRTGLEQIAQQCFRFCVPALTVQEQRLDAQDLRILRMPCHAGLHAGPRVVQPAFAFEPVGEAELRRDGGSVRGRRAFEAGARLVQPPQLVVLLAEQDQHGSVFRRQFGRALKGPVCQVEIQLFCRRQPQLEPQTRHAGKSFHQVAVDLQCRVGPAVEQCLLRLLPAEAWRGDCCNFSRSLITGFPNKLSFRHSRRLGSHLDPNKPAPPHAKIILSSRVGDIKAVGLLKSNVAPDSAAFIPIFAWPGIGYLIIPIFPPKGGRRDRRTCR